MATVYIYIQLYEKYTFVYHSQQNGWGHDTWRIDHFKMTPTDHPVITGECDTV